MTRPTMSHNDPPAMMRDEPAPGVLPSSPSELCPGPDVSRKVEMPGMLKPNPSRVWILPETPQEPPHHCRFPWVPIDRTREHPALDLSEADPHAWSQSRARLLLGLPSTDT